MIIVDSGEPKSWQKIGDRVDHIYVDFLVEGEHGKYAVERKELSDFVKSMGEGRFWPQVDRLASLRDQGYVPVVLMHGNLYQAIKFIRGFHLNNWCGVQRALAKKEVGFMFTVSVAHAKWCIKNMNDDVGGLREPYRRPFIKTKGNRSTEDVAYDVVCAFDGIGRKTADKIFKEFGTARCFLTASKTRQKKVLGNKIFKRVEDALDYEVK